MIKETELDIINRLRIYRGLPTITEIINYDVEQEKQILETRNNLRITLKLPKINEFKDLYKQLEKERHEMWLKLEIKKIDDRWLEDVDAQIQAILTNTSLSFNKKQTIINIGSVVKYSWFDGGKVEIPKESFEFDERFAGKDLTNALKETGWYPHPFSIIKNQSTCVNNIPQARETTGIVTYISNNKLYVLTNEKNAFSELRYLISSLDVVGV